MAKMSLGAYTFDMNPQVLKDVLTPKKNAAFIETYSDVAYFSWGTTMKGRVISLEWNFCPVTQYDELETLFLADSSVTFDPKNGLTYTVEIMNLRGELFNYITKSTWWRRNVKVDLLFISEGS